MKILVPVIKSLLNPLFDELSRFSSLNLSPQGIFSTLQINTVVIFLTSQFCKLFKTVDTKAGHSFPVFSCSWIKVMLTSATLMSKGPTGPSAIASHWEVFFLHPL